MQIAMRTRRRRRYAALAMGLATAGLMTTVSASAARDDTATLTADIASQAHTCVGYPEGATQAKVHCELGPPGHTTQHDYVAATSWVKQNFRTSITGDWVLQGAARAPHAPGSYKAPLAPLNTIGAEYAQLPPSFVALAGSDLPAGAHAFTDKGLMNLGNGPVARLVLNYSTPQPTSRKGSKPYLSVAMAVQFDCATRRAAPVMINGFSDTWANGQGVFLNNPPPEMQPAVRGELADALLAYHCAKQ
ncbi:hypothetical protein SB861_52270 [Paraburkholderia sp. SIMBA_049]